MHYYKYENETELGKNAATYGGKIIKDAIDKKGEAQIVLATGMSQVSMLTELTARDDIDWSKVTAFHLDEYIDLPETHPASFRKYLKERFLSKVGNLRSFNFINGDTGNPEVERERLNRLISQVTIDIAFVGIGENSHLAFNDPPADFEIEDPYIIVELDNACRKQQVGEGWFDTISDVPSRAITMTIKQILRSNSIIAAVPGQRKADAVECAVKGEIDPKCPSSILQKHENCFLFLDRESASKL